MSAIMEHTGPNLTEQIVLKIEGMTCAACSARLERVLNKHQNIVSADVNFALNEARIHHDAGAIGLSDLEKIVSSAGFKVVPDQDIATPAKDNGWTFFWVSAALTFPLVAQMILHMTGLATFALPVWFEFALAAPVQFIIGARFYKGAWAALKNGSANMDVLVALGTSAAFFYSLYLIVVRGHEAAGQLYFEASAVVITLILLGKLLEARSKKGASEALRALRKLRPDKVTKWDGNAFKDGRVEDVRVGDQLLIRPGLNVPLDGLIVEGSSSFDESLITGESLPVVKTVGDKIKGGTVNLEGSVKIEVEAIGGDTFLGHIISQVEKAQSGKANVEKLVNRISAVFVPFVLLFALATLLGWLAVGQTFEYALLTAVSVLVIACPCALGLATPTAIVAGMGVAAKAGILFRNIDVFEQSGQIDHVVFDKTGTLTRGQPVLQKFENFSHLSKSDLLVLAGGLQLGSAHPYAISILDHLDQMNLVPKPATQIQNHVGEGVEGWQDGVHIAIGNARLMQKLDVALDVEETKREGISVFMSLDKKLVAGLEFEDLVRPEAVSSIAALKDAGIKVHMLSGDNINTVLAVGQALGIENAEGQASPLEKQAYLERLKSSGGVMMVGDGLNDAPALAQSDIGVAMGSGSDIAMETSDVTLLRSDLTLVAGVIDISRRTFTKIRQNLFWAFIYNLIGLPLAAFGYLNPALAGAAMAFSSLSVVTNSLLLKRWKVPKYGKIQ